MVNNIACLVFNWTIRDEWHLNQISINYVTQLAQVNLGEVEADKWKKGNQYNCI